MLVLCYDVHICTTYKSWNNWSTCCIALDQQFRWLKVQFNLGFQLSELKQIDGHQHELCCVMLAAYWQLRHAFLPIQSCTSVSTLVYVWPGTFLACMQMAVLVVCAYILIQSDIASTMDAGHTELVFRAKSEHCTNTLQTDPLIHAAQQHNSRSRICWLDFTAVAATNETTNRWLILGSNMETLNKSRGSRTYQPKELLQTVQV